MRYFTRGLDRPSRVARRRGVLRGQKEYLDNVVFSAVTYNYAKSKTPIAMNASAEPQTYFNLNHSEGVNDSERLLTKLCQTSFLHLWAHANLFTDEGLRDAKGSGKEFCDALLIFGDDVVILSDKHINFQLHKPLNVAWSRWYKRAVQDSIKQLHGARNWLLQFPTRIFHDANCKTPLVVQIPKPEKLRVHLVAVTRGSREGAIANNLGSSKGSMAIASDLKGDEHFDAPFTIGIPVPEKPFVHVLDEVSVELLFSELDTATDLLDYLKGREELLSGEQKAVYASGEEDLLGAYLQQTNLQGKHLFIPETPSHESPHFIVFDENWYAGLAESDVYRRKRLEDKPSYWWDTLVEHFIAKADPTIGFPGIASSAPRAEEALRFMASESRFQRRLLVNSFQDCLQKAKGNGRMARLVVPSTPNSPVYIFLLVPKRDDESYADYRKHRTALLFAYCRISKLRVPDKTVFIGLGFDHPDRSCSGGSEDLFIWEQTELTDGEKAELEAKSQEFKILQSSVQISDYRADEYPLESPAFQTNRVESASKKKAVQKKRKEKLKAAARRKNRGK